jgi:hypothetical protein
MKDCIVYLAGNSEDNIKDFYKSLSLLYENYIKTFQCDVVVFHEKEFIQRLPELVKTFPNIPFKFFEIEFKLPEYPPSILENILEYFPHPTHGNGPVAWGHPGFSMGYRHMCNFFAGEFYLHPALDEYDYYMRLDSDSYLLKPIEYNVFDKMKSIDAIYGYIGAAIQIDNPKVVCGLWDCVKDFSNKSDYVSDKNIIDHIPNGKMFYNNFEIGNIKWFREKPYQSLYEHIKDSGGIYTNRWGDAPIRFFGIALLADKKRTLNITDIAYQHGAIYNL